MFAITYGPFLLVPVMIIGFVLLQSGSYAPPKSKEPDPPHPSFKKPDQAIGF
jgi:hypothetical protein